MQLETRAPGVLVSSYCCSTYRIVDPFSSLGSFSSSSIGGLVFHPIDGCEHPLLYLPGTGIASHKTAISGSLQQNLAGICNNVCVWRLIMGWSTRRWPSRPSLGREAPWSCKLYMPQYRGTSRQRSGSGWVGEQGGRV